MKQSKEKVKGLQDELKRSEKKVKAIQDELDSCADEKVSLQKEVSETKISLRELNEQMEGQARDAALEKKNSETMVILEHKVRQMLI